MASTGKKIRSLFAAGGVRLLVTFSADANGGLTEEEKGRVMLDLRPE